MQEVIKAIVVDDEEGAREVLSNLLNRCSNDIIIVDHCKDVPDAVESINVHHPDVVFLDVQMPDYAGYEIVNFFKKIDFEIIFVTAYNDYAIKAFELCAIDYLVKPIHRDRLMNAIEKLKERISAKNQISDYQTLLSTMKSQKLDKLVISELGQKRTLNISKIEAIHAQGAYCEIYIEDDIITVSKNLKYFEDQLSSFDQFFRTHKSWIINLNFVHQYSKSKCEIVLDNELTVKLSRYRKTEFEENISKSNSFV